MSALQKEHRYFSPILSRPLPPVRSDFIRGKGHVSEELKGQPQNKRSPAAH